jgi:hypothetical protein
VDRGRGGVEFVVQLFEEGAVVISSGIMKIKRVRRWGRFDLRFGVGVTLTQAG